MNQKTLRVLEYKKIIEMLINKAESSLGIELVKKLMPVSDINLVQNLQDETDEAVSLLIKRGSPPLGGIHDISGEIKRAEIGAMLAPGELLRIADALRVSRQMKGFLKHAEEDKNSSYPLLGNLISELKTFKDIEDSVFYAIVSDEEISDNASSSLKSIRRQIGLKNEAIRSKLNSIINSPTNRKYLQDAIITIREGRYVVPVKQENKSSFPGLVHDQSSSGATLFIEPMAIVNLNNDLKELKIKERQEIERILIELTNLVSEVSVDIKQNVDILAKVDFIFAKGKLSLEMKGIKPLLNDKGYIKIKNGRHPLLSPHSVVPINVNLGKDFDTLIITGPNTGGKTVSLKTVGLLTLMAQSGIQVPADYGTEMAVYDNVFADIGDEQSIEQSLSTFSSHMTNIVDILNNVKKNMLVLLDELGAGTDPTEGAALAMSVLNYLHQSGVKTIATTHYSELKVYALTTKGIENASVEFDVDSLSPTYRLMIGVPGKSNAFEISKRLGLQDYIIKSAQNLLSKENVEFEDVLATIEEDRRISERNKEESERLKLELNMLKMELEDKEKKIEDTRQNIIREAKLEANKILKNAKIETEEIIKELREISVEIEKEKNKRIQEAKDKLKNKLDNVQKDLTEDVLKRTNKNPPKNLKLGESVKVLNLGQTGNIITLPDDNGNVTVQIGIMKVNVAVSSLQRISREERKKGKSSTKNIIKSKTAGVKNEVDLRGKNLEEAILDLDKYLDDVYIAGLEQVYIIHGKGTGVLRNGISQLLKKHRHIKSYRLGKYGEGGDGVTVAQLK